MEKFEDSGSPEEQEPASDTKNEGEVEDDNQQNQWQPDQDFDVVDFKICGELLERNKALDEYALSQDIEGLIAVRVQ
jgi:hypothetical protein